MNTTRESTTTSLGLLRYASEYFEAFIDLLGSNKHEWPSDVLAYLFCHAVELTLKAYLRNNGISVKDLCNKKLFGHDLDKIIIACQKKGINRYNVFSVFDWEVLFLLNQQYKKKEFEYSVIRIVFFPKNITEVFHHFTSFIGIITPDCVKSNKIERCNL